MEAVEKKEEAMEIDGEGNCSKSTQLILWLQKFLAIQRRRAEAYAKLKRGFDEYKVTGIDLDYQKLCGEITVEFNDCSKQVIEMESLLLGPEFSRDDLAALLRAVQAEEKQKLRLAESTITSADGYVTVFPNPIAMQTAKIQILKKAGRPSERLVTHESCRFTESEEHECRHLCEITEAMGTEDAEADAEYENALNEAIRGVQDAVTNINDHLEEVRYEIEALRVE